MRDITPSELEHICGGQHPFYYLGHAVGTLAAKVVDALEKAELPPLPRTLR